MNKNKMFDKALDGLILEAIPEVEKVLMEEMPSPEVTVFSKEHEKSMTRLFRKMYNKTVLGKMTFFCKRTAIVLSILLSISGVIIFNVSALRIRFLNFVIDKTHTHSEMRFNATERKESYSIEGITFVYIPDGFKLESHKALGDTINLVFRKKEQYFIFTRRTSDGYLNIDTEQADIKRLEISGNGAVFSSNSNINILVWYDSEYSYSLNSNLEEIELIQIAENIKK